MFHENPSSGSQVVPCGRTDGRTERHDEAISRFSQFLRTRLQTLHSAHILKVSIFYRSENNQRFLPYTV